VKVRNSIKDPTIKANWDKTKTVKENLEAHGLSSQVNGDIGRNSAPGHRVKKGKARLSRAFKGFAELSSVKTGFQDTNPKRRIISDEDITYAVSNCVYSYPNTQNM
jgi:hypothetical protein